MNRKPGREEYQKIFKTLKLLLSEEISIYDCAECEPHTSFVRPLPCLLWNQKCSLKKYGIYKKKKKTRLTFGFVT